MQFCLSSIKDFSSTTEREKAKFDSVYEDTVQEVGVPSGRRARRVGDVRATYKQLLSEILDNILTQVNAGGIHNICSSLSQNSLLFLLLVVNAGGIHGAIHNICSSFSQNSLIFFLL